MEAKEIEQVLRAIPGVEVPLRRTIAFDSQAASWLSRSNSIRT